MGLGPWDEPLNRGGAKRGPKNARKKRGEMRYLGMAANDWPKLMPSSKVETLTCKILASTADARFGDSNSKKNIDSTLITNLVYG